jgi:hypothetical protein
MSQNVMLVLNKILDSIFKYPVAWASLTRAIILCGTSFGLHLTADQIASLMLVVESALGVFTHQTVTSNVKLNPKEANNPVITD